MQTVTESIPLYVWGLLMIIVFNYIFGGNMIKGVGEKWLNIYTLIIINIVGLISTFFSLIPSPINKYLGFFALIILGLWVISLFIIGIYYRKYKD